MKKTFLFALSAMMVLAMASCSKEEVKPISNGNGSTITENAIKANESNNFANTQWVCTVDTSFTISGIDFDSTNTFSLPLTVNFTYDFNATGDTALLSINMDDSDVIFVTYMGESQTIPFAFIYDASTQTGSMQGILQSVDDGSDIDLVLDFTYNVTDNTMLFTLPIQPDTNDPMSALFVSLFQHLLFSLV